MIVTPKTITLEEFLLLPETKPAREYIAGKIIQKPIPKGKHSTIQAELIIALNGALKAQKIARAFPELRCTFGDRSIVPDIAVFIWDDIPRDNDGTVADTFNIAPSWAIEILSPEQSQTKVVNNILYCLDNDTQLGWLIDPKEESVFIYFPQKHPLVIDCDHDILPVPDFAGAFQLNLGELFGWLKF